MPYYNILLSLSCVCTALQPFLLDIAKINRVLSKVKPECIFSQF